MTDQVNDAALHCGIGKVCRDRLREALQPVQDGNQNILNTPVLHLVHHREPEFGTFVLGDPETQNLALAIAGAAGHISPMYKARHRGLNVLRIGLGLTAGIAI
ncbi:hypothetical protein SAMN05444959_1388 [Paracoccus seriniphilus]|uniref:Uncharacterized protein n=1 Tax=Paracoccus seriniphilus TaxID=184748 RepID=A0A239Q2X8_9RHOB|nr:hypothetical protein SAMN05444959_1388 [Paracoccus seriniphilus]